MRRLWRMISGDNTMLNTVAASSGCTIAGSSNDFLSSRISKANPNSPPCATITPVRRDLNQLLVAGLATTATTAAFKSSMPTRMAVTSGKSPQQQADIQQHSNGDEKQPQEHFAVGADRGLDLMPEFGLREHHSGKKCAQRQRQADRVRRPGRGQHGEQHRQRKKFRGTDRGDHEKHRAQQPSSRGQHEQQGERSDADGAQDVSGIDGAHAAAQRRHQRQKQRKAQVLKQANRHGEPAVGAVVFGLLGQLRDDDGRRGHRDRAADHHGDRGRHREEQNGACGHRRPW